MRRAPQRVYASQLPPFTMLRRRLRRPLSPCENRDGRQRAPPHALPAARNVLRNVTSGRGCAEFTRVSGRRPLRHHSHVTLTNSDAISDRGLMKRKPHWHSDITSARCAWHRATALARSRKVEWISVTNEAEEFCCVVDVRFAHGSRCNGATKLLRDCKGAVAT